MKSLNLPIGLAATLFLLSPAGAAHAVLISGSGAWGSFQGSLACTWDASRSAATLLVELTNLSPSDSGAHITGFVFNNPGQSIATVTLSDSVFALLGHPDFNNGINATPFGHFDIGVAIGDSWPDGGDPALGIAVGQTMTFQLAFSGTALDGLDAQSFVKEPAQGSDHFLAVRFDGFAGDQGETVPASEVGDPEAIVSPATDSSIPQSHALLPNHPNPFNASTDIGFQLPSSAHVSLIIYDVLGRTARHLVDARQEAGSYIARWDGKDDQGGLLKSGVYFCVLEAGSYCETIKMVLAR
jgi:hypothetical protein